MQSDEIPPLDRWLISTLKPGNTLMCRIIQPEPGGYAVSISIKDKMQQGFLPSAQVLSNGTEIAASFVCVHENRILCISPKSDHDPSDGASLSPKKPGPQPGHNATESLP